jgi:tRNA (cmo5U34)-methyltransferase
MAIDQAFNRSSQYYDDWVKKAVPCYEEVFSIATEWVPFDPGDEIRGKTEHFRQLYWSTWLEKVRQAGAEEQRIQDSIGRRRQYDKDSLLSDQLLWLHAAGFVNANCVYKNYFIGLFLALKP